LAGTFLFRFWFDYHIEYENIDEVLDFMPLNKPQLLVSLPPSCGLSTGIPQFLFQFNQGSVGVRLVESKNDITEQCQAFRWIGEQVLWRVEIGQSLS
jgi:hypothetical protein